MVDGGYLDGFNECCTKLLNDLMTLHSYCNWTNTRYRLRGPRDRPPANVMLTSRIGKRLRHAGVLQSRFRRSLTLGCLIAPGSVQSMPNFCVSDDTAYDDV